LPSDLRYSLINTFTAIDQFRSNILFNLQGASRPGFNKKNTNLTLASSLTTIRPAQAGGPTTGTTPQIAAGPSELRVGQSSFSFAQGTIGQQVGKVTSIAMNGEGFFAVAESLQPGARVFMTREGDFIWKDTTPPDLKADGTFKQFHLVHKRTGLFVLRSQDVDMDPRSANFMRLKVQGADRPPGMIVNSQDERNGTRLAPAGSGLRANDWIPDKIKGIIGSGGVDPFKQNDTQKRSKDQITSEIAILRVPLKEFLQESSFGATIYETNVATRGGIVNKSYAAWIAAGDTIQVQSESLEQPDFTQIQTEANIQSDVANFVFKNLRDMLDNYNRSIDDLLGLIR